MPSSRPPALLLNAAFSITFPVFFDNQLGKNLKMNKFLSIILILMLLVTSVALFATRQNSSTSAPEISTGKAAIGGAFILTDQHGQRRSDNEFRGKTMMVFFGFTHCPDVCPLAMATYTTTLQALGDKAANLAPIFITIDPERDTPERMKDYLSNFDARIIGLTGTDMQIKDAAALYKTYHSGPDHQGMMDHSALIYIMDKNGEYLKHFPHTVAPDELTKALQEVIQ